MAYLFKKRFVLIDFLFTISVQQYFTSLFCLDQFYHFDVEYSAT